MASSKVECASCSQYILPCDIPPVNHVDDNGKSVYIYHNQATCYECLIYQYESNKSCPYCEYSILKPIENIRCSFKFTVSRRGESQCWEIGNAISSEDNNYYCKSHVLNGPQHAELVKLADDNKRLKREARERQNITAKMFQLAHEKKANEKQLQITMAIGYIATQVARGQDITKAFQTFPGNATNAITATNAINAINATNAINALTTTNATNAINAINAINATNAINAINAPTPNAPTPNYIVSEMECDYESPSGFGST